MEKKICKNCCIEKNLYEYPKNCGYCRICWNEYMRLNRPKKIKSHKICKNCNVKKDINEYSTRSGNMCKDCFKEHRKKGDNKYIKKNKKIKKETLEKEREQRKIERQRNKIKIEKQIVGKENQKGEYQREYQKTYKKKNNVKIKENKRKWQYEKRKTDPLHKLKHNLANTLRRELKENGYKKESHTYEIYGCSYEEIKIYLEKQFKPWMNWTNHGLYNGEFEYGWDIDHIIPLSSATNEEELLKLFYYTNLQPLDSKVNRHIKSDRLDWTTE